MDTYFSMKVFCQVVQSGSFTRAARQLDISVPMASKHVAHLEKTVCTRLLYRNNRHLKPTEQGEAYYRDCQLALDILQQAADQAAAGMVQPQGILRVSVPVWFSCDTFARLIYEYRQQFPQVEIVLTLTNRSVDLNSDGEDLALRLSHKLSENIIAKHLYNMPFYLCAAPCYIRRYGMPQHPDELPQHRAVLPTYTDMSNQTIEHKGESFNLNLSAAVRSNNTQMLVSLIRCGEGIGYVPSWLAEDDLISGRLIRLLPEYPIPAVPLYAVYADRRFTGTKVRSFIDFIADRLNPAQAGHLPQSTK